MPVSRRHEWESFFDINDDLQRYAKIEDYLDRGLGACPLREARAASIVEENWLHGDSQQYRLLAWVIMPNHVHLLVEVWQTPMVDLIKGWKGYSARQVNRVLGRRGKLWQDKYWDRYIRDEAHFRKVVHYIESNPVKAGLVKSPERWPFSSARFRDEYNRLKR
jgi:putative DNA methylase